MIKKSNNINKYLMFKAISIYDKNMFDCKKNSDFVISVKKFQRNIKKEDRREKISVIFYLFRKIEALSGTIPIVKVLNIRSKGKKKGVKRKNYYMLYSKILYDFSFLSFYVISNVRELVNNMFMLNLKKVVYLKEFYKYKSNFKFFIGLKKIIFTNLIFFKNLNYFKIKKIIRRLVVNKIKKIKFVNLYVQVKNKNFFYFIKLLSIININMKKVVLFLYKKLRNNNIKL